MYGTYKYAIVPGYSYIREVIQEHPAVAQKKTFLKEKIRSLGGVDSEIMMLAAIKLKGINAGEKLNIISLTSIYSLSFFSIHSDIFCFYGHVVEECIKIICRANNQ